MSGESITKSLYPIDPKKLEEAGILMVGENGEYLQTPDETNKFLQELSTSLKSDRRQGLAELRNLMKMQAIDNGRALDDETLKQNAEDLAFEIERLDLPPVQPDPFPEPHSGTKTKNDRSFRHDEIDDRVADSIVSGGITDRI